MSDDQMLQQRQKTWEGFARLMLWSIILVTLTLIVLGIWLID